MRWNAGAGIRLTLGLSALCTLGCANLPTAPSTPAPLLLSGQSQAEILAPELNREWAGGVIPVVAGGRSIAFWSPEDQMWRDLLPALPLPLSAFVWWQGESDCDGLSTAVQDYRERFADLMLRVRQNHPNLKVVVITVSPLPTCERVRSIQAEWVRNNEGATLVSADDLDRVNFPIDIHILPSAARTLARRVVEVVK